MLLADLVKAGKIRFLPIFVAGEPKRLGEAVVGQIIALGQLLADRLQKAKSKLIAGGYVVSLVPFVPVINH